VVDLLSSFVLGSDIGVLMKVVGFDQAKAVAHGTSG
jgi:hypothetical protein